MIIRKKLLMIKKIEISRRSHPKSFSKKENLIRTPRYFLTLIRTQLFFILTITFNYFLVLIETLSHFLTLIRVQLVFDYNSDILSRSHYKIDMHQILFFSDKDDSFTMSRTVSSCQTFERCLVNFY